VVAWIPPGERATELDDRKDIQLIKELVPFQGMWRRKLCGNWLTQDHKQHGKVVKHALLVIYEDIYMETGLLFVRLLSLASECLMSAIYVVLITKGTEVILL